MRQVARQLLTQLIYALLDAMRKYAVLVAWFLGIIAVIFSGFQSNSYLEHVRNIPPPHPYPVDNVFWVILFMTLQTTLLIAVLRPASYSRSWGRALTAVVISLCFFAFGAIGSMHSPPPWGVYLAWLLVITIAIIILSLWSLICAVRSQRSSHAMRGKCD